MNTSTKNIEPQGIGEFDSFGSTLASECDVCHMPLEPPWIKCAECTSPKVDICAKCFCNGVEFGKHENDHPYKVMSLDWALYERQWPVSLELRLLEAVHDCGLGNWQAVSNRLKSKSPAECERHYFKCYIHNPEKPLPEFPQNFTIDNGAPVVFKLSDNPPRPREGTALWEEMGGYSAARCEFSTEYNNYAEMDLCSMQLCDEGEELSSQDNNLYTELNLAVCDVYRNCLRERQKRKKLVRDYGLVNMRKWFVAAKRRLDLPPLTLEFLRPFMRLVPPITFDKYIESLSYESKLKTDIRRLQDYRSNGLTCLRAARLYSQLRQRREGGRPPRQLLSEVLTQIQDEASCQSWLARQAAIDGGRGRGKDALPNPVRKTAPRLNIEGLIGYEKLNDAEKEMCSEVRLVPQAYLDFSSILRAECGRNGFLRLAQARTLIKIDVNKTRRLYDFLITQGLINKDPV